VPDYHVGLACIHGVVIKDVGVEHFRNMYRKGRGTTSGRVKNSRRRRKSITRRKKRITRIILRKMEDKIIRRITE